MLFHRHNIFSIAFLDIRSSIIFSFIATSVRELFDINYTPSHLVFVCVSVYLMCSRFFPFLITVLVGVAVLEKKQRTANETTTGL
jgi:hypothetical protein